MALILVFYLLDNHVQTLRATSPYQHKITQETLHATSVQTYILPCNIHIDNHVETRHAASLHEKSLLNFEP